MVSAYLQVRPDGCALDRDFVVAVTFQFNQALEVRLPYGSARIGCKAVARRRTPAPRFALAQARQPQNAKKARVWDRAF